MNTPRISFLSRMLDALSPRPCLVCGRRLSVTEQVVCAGCNLHLPRTGFATTPYDNELARSLWGRIKVEKCAALFFFAPHSQVADIVYQMKYKGRPELAADMGRMMAADLLPSGFFDGITDLVAIPLARQRERQRGYNQSREMVRGISEITHLPVIDNAVERTTFTESQTHKQRWDRNENVKDAFRITDSERFRHRHVLLVDDIVTTGATTVACCKEIERAEDVKVSVLCLGYTKT